MTGLFNLSVTKAGEVLFDDLPVFEDFFELFAVPWHSCAGVISDINILCAAVAFSGIK